MTVAERRNNMLRSESGMALVLTLMIVVLIVALVTEFSYDVFTTTSALNNWKESQRLSLVAKSGVPWAVNIVSRAPRQLVMKYLGKEIPVENILEDFDGTVTVKVEDENSRLNLNSLKNPNALKVFKKLLSNPNLNINEEVADRILHWLDKNSGLKFGGPDDNTKNAPFDSVDELLLIKGITNETYEKLLQYVTVYGRSDDLSININTAPIPVIMSLNITLPDAEAIAKEREIKPFESVADFTGKFPAAGTPVQQNLAVDPSFYRIRITAEENRIKRVIECVVTTSGTILYWKEI